MNRPVHFEIATDDPQREMEFLTSVFGWKMESWGGGDQEYWLVTTGSDAAGIDGGLMPKNSPNQPPVVNTIDVDDIDAATQRAVDAGATVAMEKVEIPGMGWNAYLVSPTGIMFGLFQNT